MPEHYLIFDGIDTRDFGAYVFATAIDAIPRRVYTSIVVPGRNGAVMQDTGRYESVKMTYTIIFPANAAEAVMDLQNRLLQSPGYHRLEDTYHPEEFYSAIYVGGDAPNITPERDKLWMTVTFERLPERWLKAGEIVHHVGASMFLLNPALQTAKPLIRVAGNGSFVVNEMTVTVTGSTGVILIDCESKDCAGEDGENRNGNVSFSAEGVSTLAYPTLSTGVNAILSGSVENLEIIPRWWRL